MSVLPAAFPSSHAEYGGALAIYRDEQLGLIWVLACGLAALWGGSRLGRASI